MDDTRNPDGNQPNTPIFESVPVAEAGARSQPEIQPEEVSPDIEKPEESVVPTGPEILPDQPPVYVENKSKYIVIVGVVVFFLAVFFILFSLFTRKPGSAIPVKLVYWGLWDEPAIIQPLISAYQSQHPNVTIEYQKMSPDQYRDKLLARGKNGQGPDIFRFHNTWLPEIKEIVSPLPSSVMTNADFEKTFYPVQKTDLKLGSYYYGIPLYLDGLVLIYNDSLMKKAGIADVPGNWDDLITDVGKLSIKDTSGQIITSGIALGTANNIEHFSDIFALMLVQNGADLTKLDQPEAAQALEAYRKFAEKPKNYWDATQENNIQAFIHEKVAMIFAPSWEVATIRAVRSDLEIKVVPIPPVPGAKPVSIASYWVEGVSRYSKQQTEAWKFLAYLAQKDSLSQLFQSQIKARGFAPAVSRVDMGSEMAQNQYIAAVVKQADAYVSVPMVTRTFDNGLNDQIVKYIENAINATAQGTSYTEAMKTAKQGIDQVLGQYK